MDYPIVDQLIDGPRGYELRDYSAYPLHSLKCSTQFGDPIFSEQEALERIAEKDAKKSWIPDICDAYNSSVKNQKSSNYCWYFAPTRALEIATLLAGDGVIDLSAFYGAALIKRGRNQGGSGIVAMEHLAEHGTCLSSLHGSMDFSYADDPVKKADAAQHRIISQIDIDPSDHPKIWTAILINKPVTVGIPAWRHEVLITFLKNKNGKIQFGFDNSWGRSWGTNGRGILEGKMTRFDEAGIISLNTPH